MLTITDNQPYGLGIQRVLLPSGLVLWGHFGGILGYLTGSYHSTDASRQVTFSCTTTATEPDTGDLLARIFTDEREPGWRSASMTT
jgi:D-alanyl-D-alanine carboxypeptidase